MENEEIRLSNKIKCPKCGVAPFMYFNLGYWHKCHVCGTEWKQ